MRLSSQLSLLGFIMMIPATFCPVLKPFGLINWDVFDLNKPYAIVIVLTGIIGIAGALLDNASIIRLSAFASLFLVILFFMAVFLRVHTTFSFIHFKIFEGFLIRHIWFKWGWILLFGGPVIAITGVIIYNRQKLKSINNIKNFDQLNNSL